MGHVENDERFQVARVQVCACVWTCVCVCVIGMICVMCIVALDEGRAVLSASSPVPKIVLAIY